MQQRYNKPKRQRAHGSRKSTAGSSSPIEEGDDGNEGHYPHTPRSSDIEAESQVPSSEILDSQSEVDWTSLLCEDVEMLPPSNWEAEFLEYQARMMAESDDRGVRHDGSNEDPEDEPWYPYDPESMSKDENTELHNDGKHNGIEGDPSDQIVCFGAVSCFHLSSGNFMWPLLGPLRPVSKS